MNEEKTGVYKEIEGKRVYELEDGSCEPYTHQDGDYSKFCVSPTYCRCTQ